MAISARLVLMVMKSLPKLFDILLGVRKTTTQSCSLRLQLVEIFLCTLTTLLQLCTCAFSIMQKGPEISVLPFQLSDEACS
jgi:hypothetical protein